MSFTLHVALLSLLLSLSPISPPLARVQSSPDAVNDLAAALARATSEEEQEQLLVKQQSLVNSSLLAALKERTDPLIQKGDYAQAERLSQLAARIAERIGDRTGLADTLNGLGMIYYRQKSYAPALDYFQESLVIYEETGDKKGMALALHKIGEIHSSQSRVDPALMYLNRALAASQESGEKSTTASILRSIGIVHRFRGHFDLALEFYQKSWALSEELNDKTAMRNVSNSIGNIHQAQGSYELALEFYQKSRALNEGLNDKAALAVAFHNIGLVHTLRGRYADALPWFQHSIKIIEELGSAGDKGSLAYNLHGIGILYVSQGRYDQALEYYHESLKIRELINDKFGVGMSQNNIGVVYKSQGLYDQALEWFQKRLKLAGETDAKEGIAASSNNIGDIYRRQGRSDLAQEYLRKSLKVREEIGDRLGIARSLNNLALLYQDQSRYSEMLECSRRAARLAEEVNAPEELWQAREHIGIALRALGQPAEARRQFLAAITTIESLRHQVAGGGVQQQSFLENKLSPWRSMIDLLVFEKDYAEALRFAEQSKARVLLDVLEAGDESLRKSLSPQEQQTEEEHRLRLVTLNAQLTRELQRDQSDPSRVTQLKATIEKARLEYEALETSLYVAHPELRVHRGEASIIKAEELTALLPDYASVLLEYVVTNDVTYLFAVTRARGQPAAVVRVFTIPIKQAELAKQTEHFRQQLAGRDLGFRDSARKLYDLLLKPAQALLRGKTSLVIVPDDKLWDLPFQALIGESNRYVIETSAVAYAPSLTVLREMRARRDRRPSEARGSTLLALGNPALGQETIERAMLALREDNLVPPPEAEQEARALGHLYGSSRSKIYIGREAREDRVKAEAAQARILHFATHGTLNNASPMYSHLVLAQGDTNEDGLLEAWELMQMDLNAELAVLSACETARGRFGAGEGMIGLTWALFVARVPATVVSQWKVESASTRDLMVGFHGNLKSQLAVQNTRAAKAEALRRAALKVMKNPETSHPFYWAGFVLVGDGR